MSLEKTICSFEYFYLLNEIKAINRIKKLNNIELTYNSFLYLTILFYQKKSTVSSISEALGVAKSSVTQKIKELESLDLIFKEHDNHDRRILYLNLTKKGKGLFDAYQKAHQVATNKLKKNYSEEELQVFVNILKSFYSDYYHALEINLDGNKS